MLALFYGLGAWFTASLLGRVLVGAGLGITYYVLLSTFADELIGFIQTEVTSFPSAPYHLLGLSGAWQGIGYILSAVMARITIQAAMATVTKTAT